MRKLYIYKEISLLFIQKEKKVNISKGIGSLRDLYLFGIIYLVLTYVYVSSLLLSS